jgi:hypothetical protein
MLSSVKNKGTKRTKLFIRRLDFISAFRTPGSPTVLVRNFPEVVKSLQSGHGGTIGGTWGSSSALTAAALAEAIGSTDAAKKGALVVVLPHAADAEALDASSKCMCAYAGEITITTTDVIVDVG